MRGPAQGDNGQGPPMKRLSLATALPLLGAALAAQPAGAQEPQYVTEGRRLMCTTTEKLKEAERAINAGDKWWFDRIRECVQSRPGLKAEIIQQGVLTARIRVWDEDG